MKWEYLRTQFAPKKWSVLNELGAKGWEIIFIKWPSFSDSPVLCLLKRPLSKRKSVPRKIVAQVKKKLKPTTRMIKATLAYLKDEWANS